MTRFFFLQKSVTHANKRVHECGMLIECSVSLNHTIIIILLIINPEIAIESAQLCLLLYELSIFITNTILNFFSFF